MCTVSPATQGGSELDLEGWDPLAPSEEEIDRALEIEDRRFYIFTGRHCNELGLLHAHVIGTNSSIDFFDVVAGSVLIHMSTTFVRSRKGA